MIFAINIPRMRYWRNISSWRSRNSMKSWRHVSSLLVVVSGSWTDVSVTFTPMWHRLCHLYLIFCDYYFLFNMSFDLLLYKRLLDSRVFQLYTFSFLVGGFKFYPFFIFQTIIPAFLWMKLRMSPEEIISMQALL